MNGVKSKQRVADHGEVFTPPWMVEAMLDLVKDQTEDLDATFLEPACGSGNFLTQILRRKLAAVDRKYGKDDFERRNFALLALMRLYGIEKLDDNIIDCRANLLGILAEHMNLDKSDDLYRAASYVLTQNIVHGDARYMKTNNGNQLTFAEWGYVGRGKFQRRDFLLKVLTTASAFGKTRSLLTDPADRGKDPLFTPTDTIYPRLTMRDLAAADGETTKERP